MQKELFLKDM